MISYLPGLCFSLSLAQVDVPGTVIYLDNANEIENAVGNIVTLIGGAAPFKVVPTDPNPAQVIEIEDMESALVVTMIETMLKNVTKLKPSEMNAECNRVQILLQSIKGIENCDRIKLRRLIRELRDVAAKNLPQSEIARALADLCYNPFINRKLEELGNRRALTNYEIAENILDNENNEPFDFNND